MLTSCAPKFFGEYFIFSATSSEYLLALDAKNKGLDTQCDLMCKALTVKSCKGTL